MTTYNNLDIEILVSTMNKKSLDFLVPMFPFSHFSHFSILVINQTLEDCILTSDYPSVRVLNFFEKGLSKSRNLALNNAVKKICVIADDDVVYYPNFREEVVNSFNTLKDASIITFNHKRIGLNEPQKKAKASYLHSLKSIWTVSSIEMTFKLEDIKKNKISFNEYFGLGSIFETAEEFLFLRKSFQNKLKIYYSPFVLVSHPLVSSGVHEGENKIVFARSALFYKTKGILVYLWLLKYLFFLLINNYIKKGESIQKFKIGIAGIRKYKEIAKTDNKILV